MGISSPQGRHFPEDNKPNKKKHEQGKKYWKFTGHCKHMLQIKVFLNHHRLLQQFFG
jgi:hypothetical protein